MLALSFTMNKNNQVTKCFIASYIYPNQDAVLQDEGISNGLITFAVPNLGVMFRCVGEGSALNMEFSTFFSLLEFLQTKLKEEHIKSVQVLSSNPHFVFSFSTYSDCLKEGTAYRQLLDTYMKKMSIQVGYINPQKNQAFHSTADYPSIPKDKTVELAMTKEELTKTEFKSLQKGIKL